MIDCLQIVKFHPQIHVFATYAGITSLNFAFLHEFAFISQVCQLTPYSDKSIWFHFILKVSQETWQFRDETIFQIIWGIH